ncbi:oxidoreductase [Nemania sp. FL0916]|nr:oxidoreductase [Nemania sp. FL0916]
MSAESFDFIIAGGGTAGTALASRLSEVAHQTVLVLEAGRDNSDDARVKTPALYSALFGTDIDWGFRTVAQKELNKRSISLNQGKSLGGSSVMNALVYAPPTKAVLDAWAELGNVGWNWDVMGPYYSKACTLPQIPEQLRKCLEIDDWPSDDMIACGPVQLSYPGDLSHPIRKLWAQAFGSLSTTHLWAETSVGAFSNLTSIDTVGKERCHAAKAYYHPVQGRPNLRVILDAHVDKIIFADDGRQPRAVGLQYYHEGKLKTVHARKEIVISAGALQSPKLLELSGIGNANILRQHNIQVIRDLPGVGENLQDHLLCDITVPVIDEMNTLDTLSRQEPKALEEAALSYAQNRDGPFASSGILTYAYLPIMDFRESPGRKQLIKLLDEHRPPLPPTPENAKTRVYYEIAERMLGDPNKSSAAYLVGLAQNLLAPDPITGKPAEARPGSHLSIASVLAQPLSRGTVHIVSDSYRDAPEIDPKYLSHPLDMEVLARHAQYIGSMANSAPICDVVRQIPGKPSPLTYVADLDAAKRYVAARSISMWHPAGTCAMLPEEIGGVVDSSLRVYGVSGLRVVDASVVPLLPPGNLQSTIYALAERAADLIKDAYRLK